MKLHRQPAHAGSTVPIDLIGSPVCRGWRRGKIMADRASADDKYPKTNPTQAHLGCHKPHCRSALNSSGTSVGSKSKATVRGGFLYAAGCPCLDRLTRTRETNGSRTRRRKLRIRQNEATGSQH